MRGRAVAVTVAAIAVGAAVTACGAGEPAGPTDQATGPTASVGPGSPADGQDLGVCADGTCEVRVTGPATFPLNGAGGGVTDLRVESIGRGRVRFAGSAPGGSVRGRQCSVSVTGVNGHSTMAASCGSGGRVTLRGMTIDVTSVDGHAAVVRLSRD